MATPPSDDTRTLFKLLADRDWHPYEEIRDALAATVAPGRAIRKYEERLEASRKFHKAGSPQTLSAELTEDEKIFYGQRAFAQITISSWKGRGIMQRVENDKKEIRIKPGFRAYGVADAEPTQEPQKVQGSTDPPQADSVVSESPAQPPAEVPVVELPTGPVPSDFRAAALGVQPEPAAEVKPEPISVVQQPDDVPKVQPAERLAELARETRQRETDFQVGLRKFQIPKASQPVTPEPTPECSICGLGVANKQRHDQWHEEQNRPSDRPEMALLDEDALRTLLGDVMGQGLDRFQEGMQSWLQQQFAQLEASIGARRPLPQRWATGTVYGTRVNE